MSASRREFLAASAVAVAAAPSIYAAGSDVLKVGLIGCGGRGTGAAVQALSADKNVKLVAMADAFEDRLEESLGNLLKKASVADQGGREAGREVRRLRRLQGSDRSGATSCCSARRRTSARCT